ncbi:hypothetical protein D3C80_2010320 [compost metagenome]
MFSILAMPSTTVAKMMGANTILISLINASPSGFMSTPTCGQNTPNRMPIETPIRTCTYNLPTNRLAIAVSELLL